MKTFLAACLAAALITPAIAGEDDRCLMASQVNGFSKATRDSVVLLVGAKDFLVEFNGACIGLDSAISIAAVSATSCFDVGDKIVFKDVGDMATTCYAKKVTYLPKDKPTAPAAN